LEQRAWGALRTHIKFEIFKQQNNSNARSRPRGAKRPSCAFIFRPKEGVGNAGCPLHPRRGVIDIAGFLATFGFYPQIYLRSKRLSRPLNRARRRSWFLSDTPNAGHGSPRPCVQSVGKAAVVRPGRTLVYDFGFLGFGLSWFASAVLSRHLDQRADRLAPERPVDAHSTHPE